MMFSEVYLYLKNIRDKKNTSMSSTGSSASFDVHPQHSKPNRIWSWRAGKILRRKGDFDDGWLSMLYVIDSEDYRLF